MKGFLIIAQNNMTDDYLSQAIALASSIKQTQNKHGNVAIATNDYRDWFTDLGVVDDIVEIPWMDHAMHSEYKIENLWKAYWMTPYDETIVLHSDMLFTANISRWWDILSNEDIWFPKNITYYHGLLQNGNRLTNRIHYAENYLSCIFSNLYYFKKNATSHAFFRYLEHVFNDWGVFYKTFVTKKTPATFEIDLAYSIALNALGLDNNLKQSNILCFVDMKEKHQQSAENNWFKKMPIYVNDDNEIFIGNYKQTLPIHYSNNYWLLKNMDIISFIERKVKGILS